MINIYTKYNAIEFERHIFDNMIHRSRFSWSGIIIGDIMMDGMKIHLNTFLDSNNTNKANIFVTMLNDLPTCVQLLGLLNGEELHNHVVE